MLSGDTEPVTNTNSKKPNKIFSKKYKSVHRGKVSEFVKKGGIYEQILLGYRLHRFHRIFLGTKVVLKMYRDLVLFNPATHMLTNSDYAQRYQTLWKASKSLHGGVCNNILE